MWRVPYQGVTIFLLINLDYLLFQPVNDFALFILPFNLSFFVITMGVIYLKNVGHYLKIKKYLVSEGHRSTVCDFIQYVVKKCNTPIFKSDIYSEYHKPL